MKKILISLFFILPTIGITQTTVSLQPGPVEGKDVMLHDLGLYGGGDYQIILANAWTWSGTPGMQRSFFEFDLSSIPIDATIINATLFLYAIPTTPQHSTLSGSNSALIERVIEPWDEYAIDWSTQPSTTSTNSVVLPMSTSPTEDYVVNVSSLVQDMIDFPGSSYGFGFKLENENYYRSMSFCSSDFPDPTKWPKLEITYCVPSSDTIDVETCESYTVPSGDETYLVSGVYQDTLSSSGGCDSILTINVGISDLIATSNVDGGILTASPAGATY